MKGRGGALLETKINRGIAVVDSIKENLNNRVGALDKEKNIVKDYPEIVLLLDKKLSEIKNFVVSSNDSSHRDKKIENVLKRLGYV